MSQMVLYRTPDQRPDVLKRAVDFWQTLAPGAGFNFYGSIWPMYLATGKVPEGSDVDMQVDWQDWQCLDPAVKSQFVLHEPHARYLKAIWKARNNRGNMAKYGTLLGGDSLPRGNVWVLRGRDEVTQQIGAPLEVIVARHLNSAADLALSVDIEFLQMADTPEGLYVSPQALEGLEQRRLVWKRIRDRRDFNRGHRRMMKYADRLGWRCEVAPENLCWFDLA
jgi:hypothetical protein